MTNVIVNAIDVLGQEIDEGVVKISAADIQYTGGTLMLPEYHEQELVAGSTTISGVTPGKVVISIHWGINRTATFRVFIPDTDEITLAELSLQKYDSDPAVVSQVADAALRAEDAAVRAETTVGSAEAVIEARDETVAAVATLGDAQTVLDARDQAVQAAEDASVAASAAADSASDATGAASSAASSASSASDDADRAEAGAAVVGDAQAVLTARDQATAAADDLLGTALPQGVDFDTLTTARTWKIPHSGWSWPNQPAEGPGVLKVADTGNSTGNMQVQEMTTINPVRVLTRFRNSSGQWQPWIQSGIHDVHHIDPGAGRRETVIQAGLKRRGGVIGTGGKAAIALRFDHHLVSFGEKVLPLLKQHRLPWGQMINPNNIGKGNDAWPWSQLATECHNAGGEVWNHSRSHSEVTHPVHADREISRSLEDLRENVPSVWVDSWAPPGQSNYLGYEGQDTPEKHWDTYPGRLILAQHAFVRGYYPGIYQPLVGPNLIGSPHTTIDSQTSAGVQALIRGARNAGAGLTLMLHSNYLDQDGYMTSSELDQVLAYIAQLRDNGEIAVLSNAGILMADASVPVRQTNMLTDAGAGVIESAWSQAVTSRSWKAHVGVPHEAEAWVSGAGQVSLEVDVASPSYPATAEHTVTLSEGIPQRLSALVTPPMDTTGITVTLTGSVRHTGIIYRPI